MINEIDENINSDMLPFMIYPGYTVEVTCIAEKMDIG